MNSMHEQHHHMYADSAIRFRDPFAVSKALTPPKSSFYCHDPAKEEWCSSSRQFGHDRGLTPPPEMNGVRQPSAADSYYSKDTKSQYGEYAANQQVYRPSIAPYVGQAAADEGYGQNHRLPAPASRASPVRQSFSEANGGPQSSSIASNFQIPKSVNESGGSLAELAAQILQQIESSPVPLQPTRNLTPDAKPSTGFRKWVTTILSTTMVAQNVVVLALLFIYRLKKLNPTVKGKPGSEYRLLTVALMLGNKFLDDNTYTNKTWAEVSGINVQEVHIMEVEFLSNMKYCLFTSEADWAQWQTLLGRFAAFFDRASRPLPPAPVLPPATSMHLAKALPSPPASNQASPPYPVELHQNGLLSSLHQHGLTPAPSPMGNHFDLNSNLSQPGSRKRSRDESAVEPPSKRIASAYQGYTSPQRYSTTSTQPSLNYNIPRLPLPSLSIPNPQNQIQPLNQSQQLPPLQVPARAMAMVYPTATSQGNSVQSIVTTASSSQSLSQTSGQYVARHPPSSYGSSGLTSPSHGVPQSATTLHSSQQISPTYYLQQRSSPYRPVHNVSTLLYPPPSAAMQTRSATVELNQMQYQPLGRTVQHTGRLPYVSQNMWLDGSQPQEMTPIHQWPGMAAYANNQHRHQQNLLH